jgi:hypothetical protein
MERKTNRRQDRQVRFCRRCITNRKWVKPTSSWNAQNAPPSDQFDTAAAKPTSPTASWERCVAPPPTQTAPTPSPSSKKRPRVVALAAEAGTAAAESAGRRVGCSTSPTQEEQMPSRCRENSPRRHRQRTDGLPMACRGRMRREMGRPRRRRTRTRRRSCLLSRPHRFGVCN